MNSLIELRQLLHSRPELAGAERETALTIKNFLSRFNPDSLIDELGGNGLAVEFMGKKKGKRILLRCELDALPQEELLSLPYQSNNTGVAHKCGHDGHMAILAGVAERLAQNKLEKGSVVLLFQPSEETGKGALKVIEDKKFQAIKPDIVVALHNLPGFPLGEVITKSDIFASASMGIHFHFKGNTSHASEPHKGNSPVLAIAQLIQALSSIPQFFTALHESAQVTIIHVRIGEVAYGTSPGEADLHITLRAHEDKVLKVISEKAVSYAQKTAEMFNLHLTIEENDLFPQTRNDSEVVEHIDASASKQNLSLTKREIPFAWSEDFGHFTNSYQGALFGLGAGENQPALHHPDYDFPDELIDIGVNLFETIIRRLTGEADV